MGNITDQIAALRKIYEAIRDERRTGANTATRIGDAFLALLSYITGHPYIRKDIDDTAEGRITFGKGLVSNGPVEVNDALNANRQFTAHADAEVKGDLEVKGDALLQDLTVLGSAHFFELVIDKVRAAGGTVIFSPANAFTIDHVKTSADGKTMRLYWLAEHGGDASMNTWHPGDQAISMDFNRAQVGDVYSVSNKYWWALVTDVSREQPDMEEDYTGTHYYHWIEVSTTEKADGCTVNPEAGDAVAMLGSRTNDDQRKAAIMIAAYKSPDPGITAPAFVQYEGIDSFELTDANRLNTVAKSGNVFKGSFVAISQSLAGRDLAEWLEGLQHDADAHFDIWYGEGVPTLTNEPASGWATESQKAEHVGDLYFDRSDTANSAGGHCYRFEGKDNNGATVYAWIDFTDQDTLKALTKAENLADDGVITAGMEKTQLLITRKDMEAEHASFTMPTDSSEESYTKAWRAYDTAYNQFMTATADLVSEANISKDTPLAAVGLTPADFTALYYNYYASLGVMRNTSDATIRASISVVAGKVSASVTKDGLRTAGMDITDGHIVLDAAKATVTGDLTVQGTLTSSTSYVEMDGTLWTPNAIGELAKADKNLSAEQGLFVPIDMQTIRSVQVQTTDPSAVTDTASTRSTPLVVLPMYDPVDLGCGTVIPAYRRSGTHVLIRNGFSLSYNQWSKSSDWNMDSLRTNIAESALYVCTDPRLLALSNYVGSTPLVAPDGRDSDGRFATASWAKGCCYLNGRRGRWLVLLPGQQVELVSVITMWRSGTNAAEPYLAWYVVGGEGMDWLDKFISIRPVGDDHTGYDGGFDSKVTGGEHFGVGDVGKYADALFGPTQLSDDSVAGVKSQTIVVTLSADNKPYITIE